jgi:hypothetical protein
MSETKRTLYYTIDRFDMARLRSVYESLAGPALTLEAQHALASKVDAVFRLALQRSEKPRTEDAKPEKTEEK